jgi:hypothetical protein
MNVSGTIRSHKEEIASFVQESCVRLSLDCQEAWGFMSFNNQTSLRLPIVELRQLFVRNYADSQDVVDILKEMSQVARSIERRRPPSKVVVAPPSPVQAIS